MGRYSKVVKKKNRKRRSWLPESAQAFIARRLVDGIALCLLAGGLALLAALASYSHTDPSWNTAGTADGTAAVANWLGQPGAWAGDFFLQTIGLAGALAGVILVLWGLRLWARHDLSPFWQRIGAAVLMLLAGAIAFARLPAGNWLLQPYLGGSGGTLMLDALAGTLAGLLPGNAHMVVAIGAALVAAFSLAYAAGLRREEILFFIKLLYCICVESGHAVIQTLGRFYSWIRHYNDPAYAPPARKRKPPPLGEKLRGALAIKLRATPPLSTKPPAAAPLPAQPPAAAAPAPAERSIAVVSPQAAPKTPQPQQASLTLGRHDGGDWELPPVTLLQDVPVDAVTGQHDEKALRHNAELLQNVLADFNVSGDIVSIHPGPVVTLYELEPAPGIKSSRIIGLADDIARSMAAVSVRCAVIPGRNVIGIELPNRVRQTVYLRELLESADIQKTRAHLPLILGKTIGGQPVIADLAKMPHLLIAGTTGSGKSVAVNTMLLSLLYTLPPEKCRLLMIDPKMLELSVYDDIPHLLSPVVTEPGKAVVSLKWVVQEMENRYRAMSRLGVRNIVGYNERLAEARKKGETLMRKVQTGFDPDSGKPVFEDQPMDMDELPYIVVVVDEFADLMLVAGKDVESAVQRLAQMARAAGIHLIMATQRPSTDVITGVIKANFPTRISFQVTSVYDSRTILGETGAEQLLGMGDMLYMAPGGRIQRVHGPFASDEDVENVVTFLKGQGAPHYIDDVTEGGDFGDSEIMSAMFGDEGGGDGSAVDELYDQAVALVARERKASTSFIQRHLQIGYNRAARIVEEMEKQGVVGPANHVGKREILVSDVSAA